VKNAVLQDATPKGGAMKIAVAGKGGSGKTTIAGSLARVLAGSGRPVLAVDADTNPNLASMLGLPIDAGPSLIAQPDELVQRKIEADGTPRLEFTGDADRIVERHSVPAPDGIRLLVAGRVTHSGAG
jgi:CO dehydrogenase maturation factor